MHMEEKGRGGLNIRTCEVQILHIMHRNDMIA